MCEFPVHPNVEASVFINVYVTVKERQAAVYNVLSCNVLCECFDLLALNVSSTYLNQWQDVVLEALLSTSSM